VVDAQPGIATGAGGELGEGRIQIRLTSHQDELGDGGNFTEGLEHSCDHDATAVVSAHDIDSDSHKQKSAGARTDPPRAFDEFRLLQ
jgi:hypothetical protein